MIIRKREGGEHTEKIDIDFLKVVYTAELIELMVYLVVNERLVIVGSVILYCLIY